MNGGGSAQGGKYLVHLDPPTALNMNVVVLMWCHLESSGGWLEGLKLVLLNLGESWGVLVPSLNNL